MKVKEWIEFISKDKNTLIGLKLNNGVTCGKYHYFAPKECMTKLEPFLDDEVINAFPFNETIGNKNGCLLIISQK